MARTTKVQPAALMLPLPSQVASLLAVVPTTARLEDMSLSPETRAKLDRVLAEHRAAEKLAARGLSPMRKLLLVGPPGVGKTMTAAAIATSMDVPLLRVNLHAVIASHLGETSAHLGRVFDHIRTTPRAVYLFDEFDALAGARGGRETDVGEMRRVVNSLLQFIELDTSPSLLIGATNHDDMIDGAMFRRFDDVIQFPLPTHEAALDLLQRGLARIDGVGAVDWHRATDVAVGAGVGHADLVQACIRAAKDSVLGAGPVTTESLIGAIWSRRRPESGGRP